MNQIETITERVKRMVGRVLTGNDITRYGDGLTSLIGAEELSDSVRDALLELCRQQQDHLLPVIQGVHGGSPGQ